MKQYFERTYHDTAENFYQELKERMEQGTKTLIVTANPETFMTGKKDAEFSALLEDPETVIIADGIGVVKGANMLDIKITERIPGIDVASKLLELGNERKKSVYLFGSTVEVNASMVEMVKRNYPNITIVGSSDGYVEDKDLIFEQMVQLKPDIVLVGLGIPIQEKLIYKHLKKFQKGIFVGVGGSFDTLCGKKKRAPKVFQTLNLEWFYRLIKEPKRIKRFYQSNVKFVQVIQQEKKGNQRTYISDILLLLAFGLILLVGGLKPFIKPIQNTLYENRTANHIPSFSVLDFYKGTYQDRLELALADQVPLSDKMKRVYNLYDNILIMGVTNMMYFQVFDQYVPLKNGIFKFGTENHLVVLPEQAGSSEDAITANINTYNSYIKSHPNLDFYAYYIEKDSDINFETKEKTNLRTTVQNKLAVSKDHFDTFEINQFEEFDHYFYRTDHHWNEEGSYLGYQEVAKLLGIKDTLKPLDKICLNYPFSGSRAGLIGARYLYNEDFCAYPFDLPDHKVEINNKVGQYGNHDVSFYKNRSQVSYATYYGYDNGQIHFDYQQPQKENLLILGESYDNAINELIASHFNHTYNVDLRYYEQEMAQPFMFEQFVKENKIDKVLFIGNIDFFRVDDFQLEG